MSKSVPKPVPERASARVPATRKPAGRTQPVKRPAAPSPLMALHDGVIYGPIRSRRLGRSLGINLTPAKTKLCSFNCTYCQYGWSKAFRAGDARGASDGWPSVDMVIRAVAGALRTLAAQGEAVDRLTLAGHGEPTMHPQFSDVIAALRKLRDKAAPGTPIAILSNASTLDRADVRTALAQIDERYMKLDAGDAAILRAVNGCTIPVDALVKGLSAVEGVVIQAMFVRDRTGRIDNATDLAVINWIVALQRIKPAAVHIYTLDRTPAWPYLQAVPTVRLMEIGHQVRRAGIPCEVFARVERAS